VNNADKFLTSFITNQKPLVLKNPEHLYGLIKLIEIWAQDRSIDEMSKGYLPQLMKLAEEASEAVAAGGMMDALLSIDPDSRLNSWHDAEFNSLKKLKDGLGDVLVCVIIACLQYGFDISDVLAVAYDEIKDRKGKKSNGVFIKDA